MIQFAFAFRKDGVNKGRRQQEGNTFKNWWLSKGFGHFVIATAGTELLWVRIIDVYFIWKQFLTKDPIREIIIKRKHVFSRTHFELERNL